MPNNIFKTILLIGVIPLFAISCTSLTVDDAIPDTAAMDLHPSGSTVRLTVLPGGIIDDGNMSLYEKNLDETMLEKALKLSLERSLLFVNIVETGPADYTLIVKKTRQQGRATNMTEKSLLTINYKLTDFYTGKLLWQDDINTLGISTHFNGSVRSNTATQRALKKNLTKALSNIANHI